MAKILYLVVAMLAKKLNKYATSWPTCTSLDVWEDISIYNSILRVNKFLQSHELVTHPKTLNLLQKSQNKPT